MQKSFANCDQCALHGVKGKVCETNNPNSLKYIEELYIIDDITQWSSLKEFLENRNVKYLITSPILCPNNLSKKELEPVQSICKKNAEHILLMCEPKKLITIGPLSLSYNENHQNTQHYISVEEMINTRSPVDEVTEDDFLEDLETLKQEQPKEEIKTDDIKTEDIEWVKPDDNLYMFKIPEKYYTSEYRLVDIQHIASQFRIIYIFRDKDNNKEYYEVPIKKNDFYWYESFSGDNKIIEQYDKLKLLVGNHKERNVTGLGYGGDVNLTTLHSVDYFLQNQEEALITKKNILHFDMEIYTYKNRIFPDPGSAMYPISAVSFKMDDSEDTFIYLLNINKECDPKINNIINSGKYPKLTVFTNEYTMIVAFLKKIKQLNPDFMGGWNSNYFDFPYLVSRMKKLNVDMKYLSPFGNVYADSRGRVIVTGIVPLDQLKLYKELTYINLPTYKLDYVAQQEIGRKKVEYEGNIDRMYNEDIDTFIQYSITDTELLKELEDKVQHMSLQDELRRITTTSHSGASSTLGQAEGLFLTSMKKKGLVSRNSSKNAEKQKLPGAYVFDAKGGLYDGLLCDFDFTSLYPSIINSWNIGPDTFLAKVDEEIIFDYIYNKESLRNKKITILVDPIHNQIPTEMTLKEFDEFIEKNNATLNVAGTIFLGHDKHTSIFNTVITMLFEGRKVYKKLMFEAEEAGEENNKVAFNGKQMAYKILANSLYGALANEHFRFYNNDLAKSITLTGQELLKYSSVHCDEYMQKRGNISDFKLNTNFMAKVKTLTDVLYGDTDSMFVYLTDYLKDKGIEVKKSDIVLNEIEAIQSFINEKAISQFLKIHNIPSERSMIFLKNEFLFSKYYTLNGKKHYAAKVVMQEGKDVDDIEIKGLEIKRSEIPKRSQKLLSEILDVILDESINKDQIKDRVDEIVERSRSEMIELVDGRNNSIVRVVSYSKPLNQYKNMPQHIKAMLMWNCIVNEDFRYGTKGFLWNLKGIDLTKAPDDIKNNYSDKFLKKYKSSDLNCICLPEDISKLPEYFIPDMKKIMEYSCDARVENLVEPLWSNTDQLLLF